MILAIFDLDDTLTLQDTESLWQGYLVKNGLLDEKTFLQKRLMFTEAYNAGKLKFDDVITFSMAPIANLDYYAQKELQDDFARNHLKKIIIPQAQALVQSHYDRGHHVLVLSAGHEFLIEPACEYFPVHDVLCSRLVRDASGKYLPFLKGAPLYRAQKVHAYLTWLSQNNLSPVTTYFYSDSINDLPLLEHVQIPVVVNPCSQLRAVATAKGWPILDYKKEFASFSELGSQ